MRFHLPDAVRNPISVLGMAITTAMAVLFIVLALLELLGLLTNPYAGLLVFVAVPALLLAGLVLIPIGAWRSARRRRGQAQAAEWPVIDLRVPRQRGMAAAVLALTIVNIVIVTMAAYGGVRYMDSPAFCGQVCHATMEPQYVAYREFPHANVRCTACHVGPGAGAFLEAKLVGTRRLFHVVTGRVPRPVPPPDRLIRPAQDTCEGCHWPGMSYGDRTRVIREFANDETASETTTVLTLHVGAGRAASAGGGIHWHASPDHVVEYVAAGARGDTIPYVRLSNREGTIREYFAEGATRDVIDARLLRRMDCMDCHNRPAHTFYPTAGRAIDAAIAAGRIPRGLPFVRREAVSAIEAEYPNREAGLAAIAKRLGDFYRAQPGADAQLVERAIAGAQETWSRNVFPGMKVGWGTYPNNIGHVEAPGCFRCHDDTHTASDGSVIRQDCELCHTLG